MNLLVLLVYVIAQSFPAAATVSTSWLCNKGSDVTTFPACNEFLNSGEVCATISDRPGAQDCLCNQDYLDSLYGCENELRLCYLGNDLDSSFDRGIDLWNSLCSSFITFAPTTPSASAYTARKDKLCGDIKTACRRGQELIQECLSYVSDVDTSAFSSCTCRPELLRMDYSCEYIRNVSCLATEAALSSLYGYEACDNFQSVIGTGLVVGSEATQTDLQDLPSLTAEARTKTAVAPAVTSTKASTGNQQVSSILLVSGAITFAAMARFLV